MRANLASGFVLLIALVAGCANQSPVGPDQARVLLQKRDVSYSQHSFLAAGVGDLGTVRLFIQAGMDVNAQSPNNNYDTALMRATGGGHLKVVQYLHNQGADLYAENGQCVGDLVDEVRFEDPTFCNEQDALPTTRDPCRRKTSAYWAGQPTKDAWMWCGSWSRKGPG